MENTKQCPECGQTKPLKEFSWKNKAQNKRAVYCKLCFRARMRTDYCNKSETYKENRRKRGRAINQWFQEYKKTLACLCGEAHPACLEFHHIDPETKIIALADALKNGWSITRMQTEIAKCEILCANCHRKRHSISLP